MKLHLIVVPYDSGKRSYRMGRGPEHLMASGLPEELKAAGHAVSSVVLDTSGDDVQSAFDLARQIAAEVRTALSDDVLPIILAGNCISTLGGLAGFDSPPVLVWLDAHADFNTPETSPSGFLDGMALSIITGRSHTELTAALPGFKAFPDDRVLMLGVRAIDEDERAAMEQVRLIRSSRDLWSALAAIAGAELYLHIDLDSLDPKDLTANHFATPRGLSMHTLHDVINAAKANKRIACLAITAYDPNADQTNAGPAIVEQIITHVTLAT